MEHNHNEKGDRVHKITGYLEHLMDIFEIGIAIIVAVGFIASVVLLVTEMPLLLSHSAGTVAYRHFLESALDLVIGIEFIKMLIKHTPGSVVEVLLFALSRHMVLEGGNALENLLTVCAIAVIFAIRRFLNIESFDFLTKSSDEDWLTDWKSIMKKGNFKKAHDQKVQERKAEAEEKEV
jgi:hypothetical protein